jgi:hypothetical protein
MTTDKTTKAGKANRAKRRLQTYGDRMAELRLAVVHAMADLDAELDALTLATDAAANVARTCGALVRHLVGGADLPDPATRCQWNEYEMAMARRDAGLKGIRATRIALDGLTDAADILTRGIARGDASAAEPLTQVFLRGLLQACAQAAEALA